MAMPRGEHCEGQPAPDADSRELQTSFVYRLPGDEEPLLRVVVEGVPTGDEGGGQQPSTFAFELDPASGDGLGTTVYDQLAGTSYLYEVAGGSQPHAADSQQPATLVAPVDLLAEGAMGHPACPTREPRPAGYVPGPARAIMGGSVGRRWRETWVLDVIS